MADVFDKAKRSEIMSRIRSKNTEAELIVFRFLRKKGIYFQKHYARCIGCPDIALPRKKKAVFIHGDFWHGRDRERKVKSNTAYWLSKIAGNIERDARQRKSLKKEGWRILIAWESDLKRKKTRQKQLERIEKFLKSKS